MRLYNLLKIVCIVIVTLIVCGTVFFYGVAYEEARFHSADAYSESAAESQARGFFLGWYRPLADTARLRDGTLLPVPPAWAEQRWGYDVSPTFRYTPRSASGYHLALPLSAEASLAAPDWPPWPLPYTIDYDASTSASMGVSAGPYIPGIGFTISPHTLPDTLTVVVKQKRAPHATWRDEDLEPVDTIRWVRDFPSP